MTKATDSVGNARAPESDELARLLRIVHAARLYVFARYELRGSDASGMLGAICRVDDAWHELTIAIGAHDWECASCYYDDELDIGATIEDVHDEKGRL